MKKYEFVPNDRIRFRVGDKDIILNRIRAVRDIPKHDISAGQLGGYIECEDNLSHAGSCWVGGNAQVFGDAKVFEYALVTDRAKVASNAKVYGHARVDGSASVIAGSVVEGNAHVGGRALVRRLLDRLDERFRVGARLEAEVDEGLGPIRDGVLADAARDPADVDRDAARVSPRAAQERIRLHRRQLEEARIRADRAVRQRLEAARAASEQTMRFVKLLSYEGVLERGFALVRDTEGTPLKRAREVRPGQALRLQFADGSANAIASGKPAGTASERKPSKAPQEPGKQGSLF